MGQCLSYLAILAIVSFQVSCGTQAIDGSGLIGDITPPSRIERDYHGSDTIPPDPPKGLESGDWLYGRHCASCHGQLSSSSKKGRDSQSINRAIKDNESMRALRFLSASQIQRIADSLSNTDRPPQPPNVNGAQLYAQNCASCHGEISRSTKKNASSTRISSAIVSIPEMRSLSTLSSVEIKAVEAALLSTPSASTGISLYTNNCQSCHQPLDMSTKINATANAISGAIRSQPSMKYLNFLTADELSLIEQALRRTEIVNFKRAARVANRHQIISRFVRVFSDPANTAATNFLNAIMSQEIRARPYIFGGSCHRYDADCLNAAGRPVSEAEVDTASPPSNLRAGHLQRACVRAVDNEQLATRALNLAGLQTNSSVDLQNVGKLSTHFLPSRALSPETLRKLINVGQKVGANPPTLDSWRAIMVPLCSSSVMEALSPGNTQGEVYARCYLKLTGNELSAQDPKLLAIRAGSKKAATACGELLDAVNLKPEKGAIRLEAQAPETLSTLTTLHRVNSALFLNRDTVQEVNGNFTIMKRNIYDTSAPALWITRAMFARGPQNQDVRFDSIFLGHDNLSSIREKGPRPTPFINNIEDNKNKTIFGANLQFAHEGRLIGISSGKQEMRYEYQTGPNNSVTMRGSVDFGKSFGGGVLGSPVYMNSASDFNFNSDAAQRMPRPYAAAVFNDFLCRSFPAVDLNTVNLPKYVDPSSKISFRTSSSCVSCHASMDRLSSVARGVLRGSIGEGQIANNRLGVTFLDSRTSDRPAESVWPISPDNDYHRRPPTGRLFFRDYKNTLVDVHIVDISSLGMTLSRLDEPYICLTSRYYEYLTGISVDITYKDPKSISNLAKLHRDRVISIGKSLKNHQSLRRMLKEVLATNSF